MTDNHRKNYDKKLLILIFILCRYYIFMYFCIFYVTCNEISPFLAIKFIPIITLGISSKVHQHYTYIRSENYYNVSYIPANLDATQPFCKFTAILCKSSMPLKQFLSETARDYKCRNPSHNKG